MEKEIVNAVKHIKDAILQSRYIAAKMANKESLNLYFSVGGYISENTRNKKWGTGAIESISKELQSELPGLRGFSAANMKKMRLLFEEWAEILGIKSSDKEICPLLMDDLTKIRSLSTNVLAENRSLITNGLTKIRALSTHEFHQLTVDELKNFLLVGFTHHYEIISKCKTLEERLFYINNCAQNFWTVETLKSHIKADDFSKYGKHPNNFSVTIPNKKQLSKAVRSFKDEYFLDFVNIEEVDSEDDVDERVLEREIVLNIKKFVQKLGSDFCFVDSQHRIIDDDEEYFIDLLFFNRSLQSMVAIELKRGKFKPAYLGQLNFYLTLLDKYEKQEHENPSIGLLLCKEAKKNTVELAVRDYTKPMGVATYRLPEEVPEQYKALRPIVEAADDLLSEKNGDAK